MKMEADLKTRTQNDKNVENLTSTLGLEKKQFLQQRSALEDEIEDLGSKLDMASQNGNEPVIALLTVGNVDGHRASTIAGGSHHSQAVRQGLIDSMYDIPSMIENQDGVSELAVGDSNVAAYFNNLILVGQPPWSLELKCLKASSTLLLSSRIMAPTTTSFILSFSSTSLFM